MITFGGKTPLLGPIVHEAPIVAVHIVHMADLQQVHWRLERDLLEAFETSQGAAGTFTHKFYRH